MEMLFSLAVSWSCSRTSVLVCYGNIYHDRNHVSGGQGDPCFKSTRCIGQHTLVASFGGLSFDLPMYLFEDKAPVQDLI